MKRIRIVGLCLVAAFAFGVIASATASAAIVIAPELGRCKEVTKGTGLFTSATCTALAKENVKTHAKGNFEWTPGPGEHAGYIATGTTGTLESIPSKSKISCKAVSSAGEYTSKYTETVAGTIFTGCENKTAKVKCESSKANGNSTVGEIINFPLVGEFGLIKSPTKAGVDLSGVVPNPFGPEPPLTPLLANFECGATAQGNGTGAQLFVEGDVIGEITATNKMATTGKLKFAKTATGAQNPENFVSPSAGSTANTHLTTYLFTSATPVIESSNEVTTLTTTNEELLELRTEE